MCMEIPTRPDLTRSSDHGKTIVIFTAAVGGGHIAAARALGSELERSGHRVTVLDGLALMSRRLQWVQARLYAWQLAHAPWSYEVAFRFLGFRWVVLVIRWLTGVLYGDRLLRAIAAESPDVIVSTFPTVTAALGALIRAGRLPVPVIAVVTDYGVHPMWVSPDVDLHLVLSDASRRMAEEAGGRAWLMRFPVDRRFVNRPSRQVARAALGLPPSAFVCLVMGGAWGVGAIERTVEDVLAAGGYPVVVTGQNAALRARLARRFPDSQTARIFGWTDQVPLLMAAADCLIQNAGGVTCLEAIAAGVPILFYRPIPGHGRLNARVMEKEGVATWVNDAAALRRTFAAAMAGTRPLPRPSSLAGQDATMTIARAMPRRQAPVPVSRPRRVMRPALALVAALVMIIGSFSPTATMLEARALGHRLVTEEIAPGQIVVGARVTDPATARALQQWIAQTHAPAVLFVSAEAAQGLAVEPAVTVGVIMPPRPRHHIGLIYRWRNERAALEAVRVATGTEPRYLLLPGPAVNLPALVTVPRHLAIIPDRTQETLVQADHVFVIDTTALTPAEAKRQLAAAISRVCKPVIRCAPLDSADE